MSITEFKFTPYNLRPNLFDILVFVVCMGGVVLTGPTALENGDWFGIIRDIIGFVIGIGFVYYYVLYSDNGPPRVLIAQVQIETDISRGNKALFNYITRLYVTKTTIIVAPLLSVASWLLYTYLNIDFMIGWNIWQTLFGWYFIIYTMGLLIDCFEHQKFMQHADTKEVKKLEAEVTNILKMMNAPGVSMNGNSFQFKAKINGKGTRVLC